MKLRRTKKQPESRLRQRVQPDGSPRLSPSLQYRSRRFDESVSTGRKLDRETLLKPARTASRYWMQRFGLLTLLVVGVICVVSCLSVSSVPKISLLGDDNNQIFVSDQSAYQQAATKLISDSIWNRNKITINTSAIAKQLEQQFPEIKDVSVTLPLVAHRPIIYVQTAQPAVILAASSGNYVLDTSGRALTTTDKAQGLASLDLPTLTDQSGLQVRLDHQALSSDDISFMQTVVAELKAKSIQVDHMVLPAQSRELDVYISGQPYYVKFNLANSDARQQTGTFLAVQSSFAIKHIAPTQYVDVRVDGRAYYL